MTNDVAGRTNLYDLAPKELRAALAEVVSPPFRIKQITEWIHVRGVESFDAMSNIPKELRARLAEPGPQLLRNVRHGVEGFDAADVHSLGDLLDAKRRGNNFCEGGPQLLGA